MCTENIKVATCMGTPYQRRPKRQTMSLAPYVKFFFLFSFFFILLTFFRYHSGVITTRHHPLSLANARWDEFSYLFFTQDVRRVKKGPTNQIY